MDHRSIVELARRQHGIVSLTQAIGHGASEDSVQRLVSTGRWTRLRRGIYVVGAASTTFEQRALACCLATGTPAFAAMRTGARLWDLVTRSGRVEVLVEGHRRVRLSGVTVHRTIHLPPQDRAMRNRVPVTSLPRTIVDASVGQDPKVVGRWIDEAMRMHDLDLGELRSCVERLTRPGRGDLSAIRSALLLRPSAYDPGESGFEARVMHALVAAELPRPVQQHPVPRPGGQPWRLDLAYPWAMVALEPEGFEFHRDRTAFDIDRRRSTDLTVLGWDLYRFTTTMCDAYLVHVTATALDRACLRLGLPSWRTHGTPESGHAPATTAGS